MSSHKHHPPHAVSRCPHNTRVKRELLLILVRFRMSETSRGPGRRWTGRPAVQKKWAPGEQDPPTRRGALETRPGEGLEPWPPLTALGEGSVGRSIFESSPTHPRRRAWQPTVREAARKMRVATSAAAASAPDGAAEIRRCIPTPSPSSLPSPKGKSPFIGAIAPTQTNLAYTLAATAPAATAPSTPNMGTTRLKAERGLRTSLIAAFICTPLPLLTLRFSNSFQKHPNIATSEIFL
jgi:hypothetical protein